MTPTLAGLQTPLGSTSAAGSRWQGKGREGRHPLPPMPQPNRQGHLLSLFRIHLRQWQCLPFGPSVRHGWLAGGRLASSHLELAFPHHHQPFSWRGGGKNERASGPAICCFSVKHRDSFPLMPHRTWDIFLMQISAALTYLLATLILITAVRIPIPLS